MVLFQNMYMYKGVSSQLSRRKSAIFCCQAAYQPYCACEARNPPYYAVGQQLNRMRNAGINNVSACGMLSGSNTPTCGMLSGSNTPTCGMLSGSNTPTSGMLSGSNTPTCGMLSGNNTPTCGMLSGSNTPTCGRLSGSNTPTCGMLSGSNTPTWGMLSGSNTPTWGMLSGNNSAACGMLLNHWCSVGQIEPHSSRGLNAGAVTTPLPVNEPEEFNLHLLLTF